MDGQRESSSFCSPRPSTDSEVETSSEKPASESEMSVSTEVSPLIPPLCERENAQVKILEVAHVEESPLPDSPPVPDDLLEKIVRQVKDTFSTYIFLPVIAFSQPVFTFCQRD